jgi:hypothetical protein
MQEGSLDLICFKTTGLAFVAGTIVAQLLFSISFSSFIIRTVLHNYVASVRSEHLRFDIDEPRPSAIHRHLVWQGVAP